MRFQMVDGEKRFSLGERDRLGRGETDQETADQARTCGCRYAIDIVECQMSLGQSMPDQPVEMARMSARRDLRDDAAIGRMVLDLREDGMAENLSPAIRMAAHEAAAVSSQEVSMPRMVWSGAAMNVDDVWGVRD